MKKNFQQKNRALVPYEAKGFRSGFTLVETLVAVSIFTVSLLGVMTVLKSGVADISYAKQKMTATYLAQEGIEYIRNMRDTYILSNMDDPSDGWIDFMTELDSGSCNSNIECGFVKPVRPFDVEGCNQLGGCKLYFNNGVYATDAGSVDSGFIRKIWIDLVRGASSGEVKIFSKVEWTQGSGDYDVTLSENLFNYVE